MKISGVIVTTALVFFALAFPADNDLSKAETRTLAPRASNAKVDGLLFNIDGVTKYYAGTNAYWIGFLTNNADVDTVMGHLQSSGLKILRVWGFNDVTSGNGVYYQLFSGGSVTINTGANGLQRLDYVVKSAENHGIKLIINFVNNWGDYGGMPVYRKFYGVSNAADWYTNSNIQTQYKKYINAVVSRYKSSTAIFAWELANEPRCNGCNTNVIYNWAASISAYIKSLDNSHMVTLGDEGFMNGGGTGYPYTTGEGIDFAKNLGISTLDFGTYHWYPGSWSVANTDGPAWVTNHAKACTAAKKPCMFEEYGTPNNHVSIQSPWQSAALNSNTASDLFWQHGDQISSGQTANDGNTIYYGSSDWNGLVVNHVAAINSKYGNGGTPTTTTRPATSAQSPPATSSQPPTTTNAPGGTSPLWGQCGGNGWTGPTQCAQGTCKYSNDWYSQCLN